MTRKMGIKWHLREVMATRGMFSTTDLAGPLAERGVRLSREQVFRLVTGTPQRLNVEVLAALCDILECGPQDLLEVVVENAQIRKVASGSADAAPGGSTTSIKPVRARVQRPEDL